MSGRIVRLFVAAAAASFLGVSAASAGWYGSGNGCCGSAPVNWGCASSGCAPLNLNWGCGSCAPVRWGCNSCGPSLPLFSGCNTCGSSYDNGYGNGYGGYGNGYGYDQPIHVAYQGPSYDPPLTGYTYPVSSYQQTDAYPYVGNGYEPAYRPYGYPGYRPFYRGYRGYGMMRRPFYRSRVAFHRPMHVRYGGMRHAPRRGFHPGWMGK